MQKNGKVDINKTLKCKSLQWSCKSDWLDLLQPNCPWQTVNLAFIGQTSIHHYFYDVRLFLENSSIFSHKFLVLLGQSLIQKNFTVYRPLLIHWAIPGKKPNKGGWGYEFSRGTEEIASGIWIWIWV